MSAVKVSLTEIVVITTLFSSLVPTGFCQFCVGGNSIKLAHHLDTDTGYFSSNVRVTGNENVNDDSANTYSQIGVVSNSDLSIYRDTDSFYTFKLQYITLETNSSQILIWKQQSWLTAGTAIGYTPISIPNRTNDWRLPFANFNGLALSNSNSAYLCAVHDVLPNAWFNAVCTTGCNDCVTNYHHPMTPAQNWSGGGTFIFLTLLDVHIL